MARRYSKSARRTTRATTRRRSTSRVRRTAGRGRARGGVQTVRIELHTPSAGLADPGLIGLKKAASPRRAPF